MAALREPGGREEVAAGLHQNGQACQMRDAVPGFILT
ncbi:MAG: hypothetical protein JWL62_2873, partial [Hyphomicrobiales bacterium]|nr:hypothetical protein [Hyphomicrobiales bacterium]